MLAYMYPAVWLVKGAQASGKSTVAEALAARFDRAAHIRGGQFYRWAVRGCTHFDDPDQHEARRLLELRYRLSAQVADEYASAGFAAVVQDNIYGDDVTSWLHNIRSRPLHLVVLRPSVTVLESRDRERRGQTGKVAYRGGYTPTRNDADLVTTPRLGLWLDTSQMTPAETVAAILHRAAEARVT